MMALQPEDPHRPLRTRTTEWSAGFPPRIVHRWQQGWPPRQAEPTALRDVTKGFDLSHGATSDLTHPRGRHRTQCKENPLERRGCTNTGDKCCVSERERGRSGSWEQLAGAQLTCRRLTRKFLRTDRSDWARKHSPGGGRKQGYRTRTVCVPTPRKDRTATTFDKVAPDVQCCPTARSSPPRQEKGQVAPLSPRLQPSGSLAQALRLPTMSSQCHSLPTSRRSAPHLL